MISGIILAAGESRRMGSPKALLDYQGRTFIENICTSFLTAGADELIVVLGTHEHEAPLRTVVNPQYRLGQLSSLQVGIQTLSPESEAAVVNLVDHPLIRPETIQALMASFATDPLPIIIASYQGRRGHPVLFAKGVYGELLAAPLDRGAKVVVRKDPERVRELALDDPGIRADIDTPQEYAQWVGTRKI